VRKGGLEPPRYCYRQPLKTIRLRRITEYCVFVGPAVEFSRAMAVARSSQSGFTIATALSNGEAGSIMV
jgi:hypothetical protein